MHILVKNLIQSICRESLSKRAFTPKYWWMLTVGLCAAAVSVFAWMNPPLKRKASMQAGAVLARFEETLKTLPEERPHHPLQTADYAQALAKAFTLEKGVERKGLICGLLSGWVQRDVEGAVSWIASLGPGNVQDEATMAVLHQWAVKDPDAALQWAKGLHSTHST